MFQSIWLKAYNNERNLTAHAWRLYNAYTYLSALYYTRARFLFSFFLLWIAASFTISMYYMVSSYSTAVTSHQFLFHYSVPNSSIRFYIEYEYTIHTYTRRIATLVVVITYNMQRILCLAFARDCVATVTTTPIYCMSCSHSDIILRLYWLIYCTQIIFGVHAFSYINGKPKIRWSAVKW